MWGLILAADWMRNTALSTGQWGAAGDPFDRKYARKAHLALWLHPVLGSGATNWYDSYFGGWVGPITVEGTKTHSCEVARRVVLLRYACVLLCALVPVETAW